MVDRVKVKRACDELEAFTTSIGMDISPSSNLPIYGTSLPRNKILYFGGKLIMKKNPLGGLIKMDRLVDSVAQSMSPEGRAVYKDRLEEFRDKLTAPYLEELSELNPQTVGHLRELNGRWTKAICDVFRIVHQHGIREQDIGPYERLNKVLFDDWSSMRNPQQGIRVFFQDIMRALNKRPPEVLEEAQEQLTPLLRSMEAMMTRHAFLMGKLSGVSRAQARTGYEAAWKELDTALRAFGNERIPNGIISLGVTEPLSYLQNTPDKFQCNVIDPLKRKMTQLGVFEQGKRTGAQRRPPHDRMEREEERNIVQLLDRISDWQGAYAQASEQLKSKRKIG